MDVKYFLENPEKALEQLDLQNNTTDTERLLSLAEQLNKGKALVKSIKKEKSEISSKFKQVASDDDTLGELKSAMQSVSAQLKTAEEKNKELEVELRSLLSCETPSTKEPIPPFVWISATEYYEGEFTIRELTQQDLPSWKQFLSEVTLTAYHEPAWPRLIQQSFGHPTRIWAAFSLEGRILGGIPLTFFDSKLFGRFAVSMPYFNYGGIVSPWFNVARKILEYLHVVRDQEQLSHIEVRSMQADLADKVSNKKVSMVLTLPLNEFELEDQLGAKVRAQYKKAEEHNPEIAFGKTELIDDFYKVFSRNMRDLGTPVYDKQWFINILSSSDVKALLAVVYVNREPVSTAFLIGYKNMLEIPWASTVKKANAFNSNMWMYRQILGYAIREGYRFFDFGRSTRDAGTYKFKKQWGAQPYTHFWYYIVPPSGSVPELNPDNPKYKLMIAVWKRLPVWVANIIGPSIVKNLP